MQILFDTPTLHDRRPCGAYRSPDIRTRDAMRSALFQKFLLEG